MPRYRSLDHWRGFSALAVLLFHAFVPLQDKIGSPFLSATIGQGWLGVSLFFVISGYCVTERLSRELATAGNAGRFLLDRGWRLLPPYWAALALMLVLRVAALPFNGGQGLSDWASWCAAPLLLEKLAGRDHVLLVAWSLAYEFVFYLLAAGCFVVAQATRRKWTGFVCAGALAGLAWQPFWPALHGLAGGWVQFLFGSVVWLVLHLVRRRWLQVLAAAALAAGGAWIGGAPGVSSPALPVAAGFAALLLLAAPLDGLIARWPALRPLAWSGGISYSLYLTHVPLIGPLRNLLERWIPPAPLPLILLCLLCSAVALAGGSWFHRLIERRVEASRRRHFHPRDFSVQHP